jgi:hypothetical protein
MILAMPVASLKPRPRGSSEDLTGSACDALRRAIGKRERFAWLVIAFVWLGLGALFYIADLIRASAEALWVMLYFSTVRWAFRHERELQRQVEDAKRDAASARLAV